MRRLKSTITISLATFVLLLAVSAPSCRETRSFKRAVQACYDLSAAVNATPHILSEFNRGGFIENQNYLADLKIARDIALTNEEFRKGLESAGQINVGNKQAFLDIVDRLANSFADLQNKGALHLKSEQSKLAFNASLATARTALVTIRVFIAAVKQPVKVDVSVTAALKA